MAGAAGHRVFLDRDDRFAARRDLQHEGFVHRLHETHVGYGGIQFVSGFQRRRHHAAEREDVAAL